jgi:chemotaxis protein CheD
MTIEEPNTYFLNPGYIFVSLEPHLIHTVLGSCIAVCLWDSYHKFGGMSHYINSKILGQDRNVKFGEVAIPYLIKLMRGFGSKENQIRAHIVGGGEHPNFSSPIGAENANLADKLLADYHIEVLSRDVKGQFGRKVVFNSGTGEILISKINEIRKDDWDGNFKTKN